jgi:two-component system cell cycle sensor histidine kinase/response regulator CckA
VFGLKHHLKLARPDIKTLLVSGYTGNAVAYHGMIDEDIAFLRKPFTADARARKVREVMAS